ncbi:uncharacterized protein PRCAT00004816001 [Priceomyces carsonii]|uniref:uncharacterized protein n=1 Tax=Priceomyces carsonii TaxID=28549 RepID=UPI002ED92A63|nr:unnamed protein product [Priceomyces carsonii]
MFQQQFCSTPSSEFIDAKMNTNGLFEFNQLQPLEIAPSIWLGPFNVLDDYEFMSSKNIKIIINCSPTYSFLNHLENSGVAISSDVIILSLDLSFSTDKFSPDEQYLLNNFIFKFNRILQNFMSHFYKSNPNSSNLIHEVPSDKEFAINSPILSGSLKQHLFNINRLIKLLKTMNQSIEVLIVSADGNDQLSSALAMSYLMDSYNYNLIASYNSLKSKRPTIKEMNSNYYDDLLVIESLKKFYQENLILKQKNPGILMSNCKLKRRNAEEEDMANRFVTCGGYRKRRFKYPGGI